MRIFLGVVFLLIVSSVSASAIRCGNDLVQVGMSKIDVIGACGMPDMEMPVETVVTRPRRGERRIRKVIRWIYNDISIYEVHIFTFTGDRLTGVDWRRKN